MALVSRLAGPDNAVPSLPGSHSWLSEKKQKKIRSLFLHVLVQSSYILDVVGTFWIWSSTNTSRSLLVRRLWLCLTVSRITCAIYSRSLYATSQRHDLWQWCNGKAIEALVGRHPTARWLCLRMLVSCDYPCSRNRESNFFLTDLLTFFNLFVWKLSKKGCHRFFYSFPMISGDETKSANVEKHLFLYVSKYFGSLRLTFELWNSVATFCR